MQKRNRPAILSQSKSEHPETLKRSIPYLQAEIENNMYHRGRFHRVI